MCVQTYLTSPFSRSLPHFQIQLERLVAKQMEILHDAAAQDRLQALDWRIPAAAFKHAADRQATNGVAAADKSAEQTGKAGYLWLRCANDTKVTSLSPHDAS